MTLQSQREWDVTREKLWLLEERFEARSREQGGDEHARELNREECHVPGRVPGAATNTRAS